MKYRYFSIYFVNGDPMEIRECNNLQTLHKAASSEWRYCNGLEADGFKRDTTYIMVGDREGHSSLVETFGEPIGTGDTEGDCFAYWLTRN